MVRYVGSSELNCFIDTPAKWLVEYRLGIKSDPNVYAWRGHAVEHGLNVYINTDNLQEALYQARQHYLLNTFGFGEENLGDMLEVIYKQVVVASQHIDKLGFKSPLDTWDTQHEVYIEKFGLMLRCKLDYYLPQDNVIIDLKSKSKLPTILTMGKRKGCLNAYCKQNIRQQVFYNMIKRWESGDSSLYDSYLLYISDSGDLLYKLQEIDYKDYEQSIEDNLKLLKLYLTYTLKECINKIDAPTEQQLKYGFWGEKQINKAKELWNEERH